MKAPIVEPQRLLRFAGALLLSGLLGFGAASIPLAQFGIPFNFNVHDLLMALGPGRPVSGRTRVLGFLSEADGPYFKTHDYVGLQDGIARVMAQKPLFVLCAFRLHGFPPVEEQQRAFVRFANQYSNLYFYTYFTETDEDSLVRHPILKDLKHVFVPLFRADDRVSRNIIFDLDLVTGHLENPLLGLLSAHGIPRAAGEFDAFLVRTSHQAYQRYRGLAAQAITPLQELAKDPHLATDQIVVLGGDFDGEHPDNRYHSPYSLITIDWRGGMNAAQLLRLNLETFIQRDPVQRADDSTRIWITVILFTVYFYGLLLLGPWTSFLWGFACLFLWGAVSWGYYVWGDLILNLAQFPVAFVPVHFLMSSILLTRYLRRQDRELAEREKALEIQKVQAALLVRATRAEVGLKIATQVAHDIRSPLTGIRLVTHTLAPQIPGEAARLLLDASSRLQKISDDLLRRFRQDDYSSAPVAQVVHLRELISGLLAGYRAADLTLEVEIDPALAVSVPDVTDLERAFANLFTNAVEAMNGVGRLRVRAEGTDIAEIHLEDSGPGIPPALRARLFERGATFGKAGGTGLGLAQARETFVKLGGSIELRPSTTGAHFLIRLPRAAEDRPALALRPHVVIVEDNEARRETWARLLRARGHDVRTAASPEELARLPLPDVFTLLTDLVFDQSQDTGFDVLRHCAELNCDKILCSSLGDHPEIRRSGQGLADLIITKTQFDRWLQAAAGERVARP